MPWFTPAIPGRPSYLTLQTSRPKAIRLLRTRAYFPVPCSRHGPFISCWHRGRAAGPHAKPRVTLLAMLCAPHYPHPPQRPLHQPAWSACCAPRAPPAPPPAPIPPAAHTICSTHTTLTAHTVLSTHRPGQCVAPHAHHHRLLHDKGVHAVLALLCLLILLVLIVIVQALASVFVTWAPCETWCTSKLTVMSAVSCVQGHSSVGRLVADSRPTSLPACTCCIPPPPTRTQAPPSPPAAAANITPPATCSAQPPGMQRLPSPQFNTLIL